jgi:hypothetical protein
LLLLGPAHVTNLLQKKKKSLAGRPASEAADRCGFPALNNCFLRCNMHVALPGWICRDRGLKLKAVGTQSLAGRPASEAANRCVFFCEAANRCEFPALNNFYLRYNVHVALPGGICSDRALSCKAVNMMIACMCMHVCFGCYNTIFTAGRNVWCIHCML